MTKELAALIERARTFRMTGAQKEAQRRSFAYGNTRIENERITREMVDDVARVCKAAVAPGRELNAAHSSRIPKRPRPRSWAIRTTASMSMSP